MTTVMLTGLGALGGWALEFLARSPDVTRIVTMTRSAGDGPSRSTLAMLGSMLQGHAKRFEHHIRDLTDTTGVARLIREVSPDVVVHSATVQSPRRLMQARVDPGVRARLRAATFGLWLPWHLLPATLLTRAIESAGVDPPVVNAAFPDVVNPAIWARFGRGPVAGAGNVEVAAAQVERFLIDTLDAERADLVVRLVGSHALLAHGPDAGVPHRLQILLGGDDVTADHALGEMLAWPEPIDWSKVDVFSLFGASAVKNALALVGESTVVTHMSAPNGLPGGYPVEIDEGRIMLDLPDTLTESDAAALNTDAAAWDGIAEIGPDGVRYTAESAAAMEELGHHDPDISFDDLAAQAARLSDLYRRLTHEEAPVG
jgi:hypothetical protein